MQLLKFYLFIHCVKGSNLLICPFDAHGWFVIHVHPNVFIIFMICEVLISYLDHVKCFISIKVCNHELVYYRVEPHYMGPLMMKTLLWEVVIQHTKMQQGPCFVEVAFISTIQVPNFITNEEGQDGGQC